MEDYKQKYEGALERARVWKEKSGMPVDRQGILDDIFPELKESEDERIRKGLINTFSIYYKDEPDGEWDGKPVKDIIAWLEKQAEQKPDTKCLLSWSETDEKMLQSLEGIVKDYRAKAEQEKNEIKIREASNVSYFLKTIQKSPLCWIKCSDGLPNRDGTYLVVTDGRHNDVYDMARYDSIEGWHKASEIIYWMPIPQLNNKSIIEQKTTDKIKPKKKLKNIKQTYFQKQEWTGYDEKAYEIALLDIDKSPSITKNDTIDWLKSLKNRVLPQPKQEWSEEDEKHLLGCINYFTGITEYSPYYKDFLWLKSLKERYNWKPSDEQMEVLYKYAEQNNHDGSVLTSLYQDLKKLREE